MNFPLIPQLPKRPSHVWCTMYTTYTRCIQQQNHDVLDHWVTHLTNSACLLWLMSQARSHLNIYSLQQKRFPSHWYQELLNAPGCPLVLQQFTNTIKVNTTSVLHVPRPWCAVIDNLLVHVITNNGTAVQKKAAAARGVNLCHGCASEVLVFIQQQTFSLHS